MSACCAKNLGLSIAPARKTMRMPVSSKWSEVIGLIKTTIILHNQTISDAWLYILKSLVGDLIIGTDLLKHFETVCFSFGGDRPALHLNAVPLEPQRLQLVIKMSDVYTPLFLNS